MQSRTLISSTVALSAVAATWLFVSAARPDSAIERVDFGKTITATQPAYNARVAPVTDPSVKEFIIPITHGTIEIAKGVKYEGWTFGGTVPGPVIRVREGDRVRIKVVNKAQMPHSIDFHSARIPANIAYRPINAGDTLSFELVRFGTIFPRDWRVKLFAAGLIFSCLLIPIGTEARTGLVCIAVLGLLLLRDMKRRILYLAGAALLALGSIPFLPASFTQRMDTIQNIQADQSAGTRLAVWAWTWDYALAHPFGGGFGAYRSNRIQVQMVNTQSAGEVQIVTAQTEADEARAYHSSYFEMLGEQGFPGLFLYLLIQGIGLARMEVLRRRYKGAEGERAWISPLATALQHCQLVYLVGSLFVGIAFQSFGWLILAVQIGFDVHCSRRERQARKAAALIAAPALT